MPTASPNQKMQKAAELMWLSISAASLGIGLYELWKNGLEGAGEFLLMAGFAFLIYFWRRRLRLGGKPDST